MENMKEMEKANRIMLCLFNLFFVNSKFIYGGKGGGNELLRFFLWCFYSFFFFPFVTSESHIPPLVTHKEIHPCPRYDILLLWT